MNDDALPASGPADAKTRSFTSFDLDAGSTYTWTTRVRSDAVHAVTVYARTHAFRVWGQASFKEADPHPSAIEYLLGALGADLVSGFSASAARRGVVLDALEATVSGRLNNPLVFLGVAGESGHAGFEVISGILYVSTDADPSVVNEIWHEMRVRSPLINTLQRCLTLTLELQIIP